MTGPFATGAEAWLGHPAGCPIPVDGKAPILAGTTGRAAPAVERTQLDRWVRKHPRANVGLRLAACAVGLDEDAYDGRNGERSLKALEAALGPLPPTVRVTSRGPDQPSGIRIFRWPPDLDASGLERALREIAAEALGIRPSETGIDVVHRGHRHVLTWPSVHPITGATVTCYRPDGTAYDGAFDWADVAALPPAWVAAGRAAAKAERPTSGTKPPPGAGDAFDVPGRMFTPAQARTWLDSALSKVGDREGFRSAGLMALHLIPALFGREDVERELLDAQRRHDVATGATDPRTWQWSAEAELAEVWGTSRDDWLAQRADAEPEARPGGSDDFERRVRVELETLKIRDEARRRFAGRHAVEPDPPVGLADLLAEPDEDPAYRVEGLWPTGGRVVLAAQRKAGKTTLVGNLVRCLVDGEPFLDRFEVTPTTRRVVVLDFEMDRRHLRRWLADQAMTGTDRVTVWPLKGSAGSFDILDPAARAKWAGTLRDLDAEVLVVDCLRPILDALGLDENHDCGRVLVALDELMREAGIEECLVVHHAGHSGERSRGDSRLRDWPEAEWRLVREGADDPTQEPGPDARRFFAAEGRDVAVAESVLEYSPVGRRLTLGEGGSRKQVKQSRAVEAALPRVVEALREAGAPLSKSAVEKAVGGSRNAVRAALDAAVLRGLALRSEGPRGALQHSLPEAPRALNPAIGEGEGGHTEPDLATSPHLAGGEVARCENDLATSPRPIGRRRGGVVVRASEAGSESGEVAEGGGEVPEPCPACGRPSEPMRTAAGLDCLACRRAEPTWSAEESAMRGRVEGGEAVVASMRKDVHTRLIAWAKEAGLYVRVDRRTVWGNPFEMPADGDRATVIKKYEDQHLPRKPELLAAVDQLKGRLLGCWCSPEPCHGDVLARLANHPERKRS